MEKGILLKIQTIAVVIVCGIASILGLMTIMGALNVGNSIIIAAAKAASSIETVIAAIGMVLIVAGFVTYPGLKDDETSEEIRKLRTNLDTWLDRYEWFDAYLKGANKGMQELRLLAGRKAELYELVEKVGDHIEELEMLFQRVTPLYDFFDSRIAIMEHQTEAHRERDTQLAIILSAIGLGLLVIAIILPSTDTLLGFLASSMVDPSLEGQERLQAILKMKSVLTSL